MSENIWISCAIVYNMIHTHNSLWTVLDQLVSVHTSEGVLKLSDSYWKAAKTSNVAICYSTLCWSLNDMTVTLARDWGALSLVPMHTMKLTDLKKLLING